MMRRFLLTILLGAGLATIALSQPVVPRDPDYVILQNSFSVVKTVGRYVLGMQAQALVLLAYDEADSAFRPISQEWLNEEVVDMKKFGDLLALRCADDGILFYDASNLPQLKRLGRVAPPVFYDDYIFTEGSLYLSLWFDGIQRFKVTDFQSLSFADSSMIGVLVTSLDIQSDTLYAIDRYNGLMRYDVADGKLDHFIDYMLVPFQVTSFTKVDSLFVMASLGENAYIGKFGQGTAAIIDTIVNDFGPTGVFATDAYIAIYSDRYLEIIDRSDYGHVVTMPAATESDRGDVVTIDGRPYILLPSNGYGLTLYSFDDEMIRRSGLSRPGPITDLLFRNDRLFITGGGNPIDIYNVDTTSAPDYQYSIYRNLLNAQAIETNGDSLIVYYGLNLNRIAIITHANEPDSALLESSFMPKASSVQEIRYSKHKIDTTYGLFVINLFGVDAYSVSDSAILTYQQSWSPFGGIGAIEIIDSIVVVATNKRQLQFYVIRPGYNLDLRASLKLTGTVDHILEVDGRLWVLEGDQLKIYNYDDPNLPELEDEMLLPFSVTDIARDGDYAYAVGAGGLMAFDLRGDKPTVVSTGGRSASMVVASHGVVAASDTRSVAFYYFPTTDTSGSGGPNLLPTGFALWQNYPNPFNSTTTIKFELKSASFVRIDLFNQLGQQIAVLENRRFDAGVYSTVWDGRNGAGQDVASGVYFYRLEAGSFSESRQMLLLK